MTRLPSDADTFVDEALNGLVLAHPHELRRTDGGVLRAQPLATGKVAVVVGGGSGHYPAFAGMVGVGMAAAAVCGNIFASPSAGQAVRVARAADAGGGVLFSFGNYAGDVIQFGEAERRLRSDGIDARTVLVTDDIASAPIEEAGQRRGIAGDLCVFRIAGAAAERGDQIDEVERLARHANERARSLGVAFSGCTLPGAAEPLFRVPEGMMSIGLGIHGEPGIRDVPIQGAKELAQTLLEPLLQERPDGAGDRVALLVNGLGTVKYEELFVLFGHLHRELTSRGITVTSPLCGELVTSLDMGGVSVTLLWLDDELEELWDAPAAAPGFRRGTVNSMPTSQPDVADASENTDASETTDAGDGSADALGAAPVASDESQHAASIARDVIAVARTAVAGQVDQLGALDAIAGDGDHGIGMIRGLDAALESATAAPAERGVAELLTVAGEAWSDAAGGTSGALWSAALAAFGAALEQHGPANPTSLSQAVTAARQQLQAVGGAELGDKTMLDAIMPFETVLGEQCGDAHSAAVALRRAANQASASAEESAALSPRKGRARPLAERSVGHPDPGAVSFALIVDAIATWLDSSTDDIENEESA